ncbi:MAG: hypothetical protein LH631_09940 [Alkalinema sp. CAN_BIN05]|nr:hypothetical protein [Alkalinema sp. CAN_BIN05]
MSSQYLAQEERLYFVGRSVSKVLGEGGLEVGNPQELHKSTSTSKDYAKTLT